MPAFLRLAAVTLITSGDLDRADKVPSDALSLLPEGSPELPSGLYHMAQLRWSEGKHEEAYKNAERAVTEAEKANNPEPIAKGYEMLALACHSIGLVAVSRYLFKSVQKCDLAGSLVAA